MKYYMITNTGTLKASKYAQAYPFHMVLAQVLRADPDYYLVVKEMVRKGAQVILDNGAHEGHNCTLSQYLDLVMDLKPWCVVLPDLIGVSAIESRARAAIFYRMLVTQLQHNPFKEPLHIIYVPQGRTPLEIVDDYLWLGTYGRDWDAAAHPIVMGLGDSYKACITRFGLVGCSAEASRTRLLKLMLEEDTVPPPNIHILGGRDNATPYFSTLPNVFGIDSVDPCRNALTAMGHVESLFSLVSTPVASDALLEAAVETFAFNYGAELV